MQKTRLEMRGASFRFRHFSHKGYALFACVGRLVTIGTLSVATLQHAKAEGISIRTEAVGDTLQRTEQKLDEVVVTGSRAPLTQSQAAKIVSVITREEIRHAAAETVNDVLKMATGVDVRQRGGFGVQTDISILGGTHDQIAILLNGVNISNPQTGHHSAEFPVSLDDIQRIEIIEGAASRIYGASAFNGAINIVTTPPPHQLPQEATPQGGTKGTTLSAEGGSFGTFGMSANAMLCGQDKGGAQWNNSLSAGYKQSDGGTENSYFRKSQAFCQGGRTDSTLELQWQLGISTMRYGANTFYSAAYPDQYESEARLFAAVSGETQGRIHFLPTLYWHRSYDHFQLTRGSESGENFHRADVFGAILNAYTDWRLGRTAIGSELRQEGILSTNLGKDLTPQEYVGIAGHKGREYTRRDQRTDISYFVEHNVLLPRFTASVGVVANMNTAYSSAFRLYPGIDMSFRPLERDGRLLKLTASWNMAFRMPTFTDLYYKSPTHDGNQGLKPEQTQSFRVAAQYRNGWLDARISGFYDLGTDMIDWVMYRPGDVYHSANFSLDNRGYELNLAFFLGERLFFPASHRDVTLRLGYARIDQKRHDDTPIYKSNYAMEYLRHKFTAQLDHPILSRLTASWHLRWQQRTGSYILYRERKATGEAHPYQPYSLIDLKLGWKAPRYELTLALNNLTSRRYYDFGNIPQPGFWLMAGAKYRIWGGR